MTIPPHVLASARNIEQATYIYDLDILRTRLGLIEQALPLRRKRIHFATMANDQPEVLAAVAAAGCGVFVNSPAHLGLALDAGIPSHRVIYAASNMSRREMQMCLDADVHLVLDSAGQIADFDPIAPAGTAVGIRVNAGSAIEASVLAHEPSYRFGLLSSEADAARRSARNLRIVGVHCYFGTDIMDSQLLLDGLSRLASIGEMLPDLEYVDGGGGFGISDDLAAAPFDFTAYGKGAAAIMARLEAKLRRPVTLIIEPGRWLTAPIGWFFARVVDVKVRPDRIFAGVAASVVQFPRMLLHPDKARHPCEIVACGDRPTATLPVWITGNSTYSRDFLARGVALPIPRPSDLVAFHHAGAYCRSMLTRFLGKELPEEVFLNVSREQPYHPGSFATAAE
jgi:diaminopimelate decarboxylase